MAATGLLRRFAEAGMLRPIDFHLARRMAGLTGESDERVELALALATRELRLGSVCLDLTTAHELVPEADLDDGRASDHEAALAWPGPDLWFAAVRNSPSIAGPDDDHKPFRLVGPLLYLDRYWVEEQTVADALRRRSALPPMPVAGHRVTEALTDLGDRDPDPAQDAAVKAALTHATTVVTGGPGTGKTSTVARILRGLATRDPAAPACRVALAAPTGKAATRLEQSVQEQLHDRPGGATGLQLAGTTLHKLLGMAPRRPGAAFGTDNPLPYDVVVVDETSMVSLSLMALLLSAVGDATRLVLIGDPQQLTSVEAGAVLADIANSTGLITTAENQSAVVPLTHNWRSNEAINALAAAIQDGDADAAVALLENTDSCTFTPFTGAEPLGSFPTLTHDLRDCAEAVVAAAAAGDGPRANAELARHRVLCAHREGPFGVGRWGEAARTWLSDHLDVPYGGATTSWIGQPLLITRNSGLLSNGDTAVVIAHDGRRVACVDQAVGNLLIDPALLDDAVDLHAMTIHKSQGSQFDKVSIVLPPLGSPLLTRELLYTAVTRARERVRLYGSLDALAHAIRTPVRRASGLGRAAGAE